MKSITVKSPTRVDLAGGTLDLWPLYNFVGGAKTVNVAINLFTTVEITELHGTQVELISDDLKSQKSFASLSECLNDTDTELDLLKAQLRFWKPSQGFRLRTHSESPVGGGLGGSSSLTIGLLKAFGKFCAKEIKDIHQMVRIAHNIESQVLNTPTGTQDYYPAASGGINILTYSTTGIEQQVLSRETEELNKHFILVYTGKAHHSGLNNFEVLTNSVRKEPQTIQALKDLKVVAEETAQAVEKSRWSQLPALFRREFEARIALAPAFSSPEIEKLAEVSLHAGAAAVKICGAGGGGCVLVWAEADAHERVSTACQKAGFQVLAAKPVGKI